MRDEPVNDPVMRAVLQKMRGQGIGRPDFVRALKISQQTFTNWRQRGLPPASYVSVAAALGCSVDELLGKPTERLSQLERALVDLFRRCSPNHQSDLITMARLWSQQNQVTPVFQLSEKIR